MTVHNVGNTLYRTLDAMIYDQGRLDNCVAFSELKRQSLVNAIANCAPTVGFGEFLRRQLPAYR